MLLVYLSFCFLPSYEWLKKIEMIRYEISTRIRVSRSILLSLSSSNRVDRPDMKRLYVCTNTNNARTDGKGEMCVSQLQTAVETRKRVTCRECNLRRSSCNLTRPSGNRER
jgi:hypothetical protein